MNGNREQYPAAPPAGKSKKETEARQEWFAWRNAGLQRGIKPPESGTFGKGVPDKKS